MLDRLASTFAQPRGDLEGASLPALVSGKLSRFLARNIRTRALYMLNTRPMVTFTFDDVPASACNTGAHIIEKYGARGTFYVSGGGCDSQSPGGRLASAAELKELHARGHEIGCHTFSHYAAARVSVRELESDLELNHSFLKSIDAGIAGRNFAYPYGDLSFRTKRYLDGRFDSCRTLIPGINHGTLDLSMLKTWALEDASTDRKEIAELTAATVRKNGWFILSCHDVDEQPSRFGVSPALLEFAAKTTTEAGCLPVTIAEGLRLARGATSQETQSSPGRQTECVR